MKLKTKRLSRLTAVALSVSMIAAGAMQPAIAAKASGATEENYNPTKKVIEYFGSWHGKKLCELPWDRVTTINHSFWHVVPASSETDPEQDNAHVNFKIESLDYENDFGNE